jgi:hypothetical protein
MRAILEFIFSGFHLGFHWHAFSLTTLRLAKNKYFFNDAGKSTKIILHLQIYQIPRIYDSDEETYPFATTNMFTSLLGTHSKLKAKKPTLMITHRYKCRRPILLDLQAMLLLTIPLISK